VAGASAFAVAFAAAGAAGCVYEVRTLSLNPAPVTEAVATTDAPPGAWRFSIVDMQVPADDRSGRPWDADGPPDPYVIVRRDGREIFRTPVADDTLSPTWDATAPDNLMFGPDAVFRVEAYDMDAARSAPIGVATFTGVPVGMVPGAPVVVRLDTGATVRLRFDPPRPHRGIGIRRVEERGSALVVLDVEPYSPAGRAGVTRGERIVTLEGEPVDHFGPGGAAGKLSQAAGRGIRISVERPSGVVVLDLDRGYTWVVR
jgi:hypothetical protein